jgi:hypothetical protein
MSGGIAESHRSILSAFRSDFAALTRAGIRNRFRSAIDFASGIRRIASIWSVDLSTVTISFCSSSAKGDLRACAAEDRGDDDDLSHGFFSFIDRSDAWPRRAIQFFFRKMK